MPDMSEGGPEDPSPAKVYPFSLRLPVKPTTTFQPVTVPAAPQLALFPLGSYVVASLRVFNTVLQVLEEGTAEERQGLSTELRRMYYVTFQL